MNIRRFSKAMDRANLWRKKERRHEKRVRQQYPPALFNIGWLSILVGRITSGWLRRNELRFRAANKDYAGLIAAMNVPNTVRIATLFKAFGPMARALW